MSFIFFFSSRRRHTRYIGDWSSDVCSSDLPDPGEERVKTLFAWRPEHNLYGGYEKLLDNQPLDEKMPGPGIGWDGWGNKERDVNSRSVITRPPTVVLQYLRSELPLAQALPLHFRLHTDFT